MPRAKRIEPGVRVDTLTDAQVAKLAAFRKKWLDIGLSTKPADRAAAELGVDQAYRAAGLEPPLFKVWLRSPFEGIVGAAYLAEILRHGHGLFEQAGRSAPQNFGDTVGQQVRQQVEQQVRQQVRQQVGQQVGQQVRQQWGNTCWGQHDASWLAYYEFFGSVVGLVCVDRLAGLTTVARSAGWWWPMRGGVVLTERPAFLAKDDQGRLHCETRAAIEYPDGWGIYAWHGTRVPEEWIKNRAGIDPATALNWKNVEQRRAAAEIIGWKRVLEQLKPKTIDTDASAEIGTLLEVNLPDAGKARFLRVRCGTGREFVLPVPLEMKTARQANAWTYGMDADDLKLELRT